MEKGRAIVAIRDPRLRQGWEIFLADAGLEVVLADADAPTDQRAGVVVADRAVLVERREAGRGPLGSDTAEVLCIAADESGVEAGLILAQPGGMGPVERLTRLLRAGEDEWRDLFDRLADAICVLDDRGVIVRCNRAMTEMVGTANGGPVGRPFAATMAAWTGGDGEPWQITNMQPDGTRSVVWRELGDRSLRIVSRPMPPGPAGSGGVVVVISDLTEEQRLRGQVAAAEVAAADRDLKIRELERDIRILTQFSTPTSADAPAVSLSRNCPDVFCQVLVQYIDALELAIDKASYKVDRALGDSLREIAQRLGAARAGPRDVIELHSVAVRQKGGDGSRGLHRAFADEARLLLLQLMGHLVSYYRVLPTAPSPDAAATLDADGPRDGDSSR